MRPVLTCEKKGSGSQLRRRRQEKKKNEEAIEGRTYSNHTTLKLLSDSECSSEILGVEVCDDEEQKGTKVRASVSGSSCSLSFAQFPLRTRLPHQVTT